ncbi:MAG: type II secretion system F family protein [Dermatophilaceae bacterium]
MTTPILALLLIACGIALWPWDGERAATGAVGGATERRWHADGAATDVALTAQLLVVALRTGLPVVSALERVAEHSGPQVAADLHRVVRGYARHPDDPLLAWAAAPDIWRPVGAALAVAARAGVPPGPLLATAARGVLRRESEAREVAIGRAGVRLVLPLGLVLLPAFMCTTVLPLLLVMTRRQLEG